MLSTNRSPAIIQKKRGQKKISCVRTQSREPLSLFLSPLPIFLLHLITSLDSGDHRVR